LILGRNSLKGIVIINKENPNTHSHYKLLKYLPLSGLLERALLISGSPDELPKELLIILSYPKRTFSPPSPDKS
jgi:hypothetical protein